MESLQNHSSYSYQQIKEEFEYIEFENNHQNPLPKCFNISPHLCKSNDKLKMYQVLNSKKIEIQYGNSSIIRINSFFAGKIYSKKLAEQRLLTIRKLTISSSTLLKHGIACSLSSIAEDIGRVASLKILLPKILMFTKEEDSIKLEFLSQLPQFCRFISTIEQGYKEILSTIIPQLQSMLIDINQQVN